MNKHSLDLVLGSCAAVSLFSACPAVTFAILSVDNAPNSQFFSPQERMHMGATAAVFGVLAALALTVALVALIVDHVSTRASQETTEAGSVNSLGSINQ